MQKLTTKQQLGLPLIFLTVIAIFLSGFIFLPLPIVILFLWLAYALQ